MSEPGAATDETPDDPLATRTALLQFTRTALLRVKRRLDEAKATAQANHPTAEPRPALPASHFLGIDIEADLGRLAEEIERSVAELLD